MSKSKKKKARKIERLVYRQDINALGERLWSTDQENHELRRSLRIIGRTSAVVAGGLLSVLAASWVFRR